MSNKSENSTMLPGFDDDQLKNMLSFAKAQCPTYKCNFPRDDTHVILGGFLFSQDDDRLEALLKEKAIMDDLDDNTMLSFDRHHIMELMKIFYGMLVLIQEAGIIPESTVKIKLEQIGELTSQPIFYSNFKANINKFCNRLRLLNHFTEEAENAFKIIMKYIWFIPYVSLDEMLAEFIEDFKKEHNIDG